MAAKTYKVIFLGDSSVGKTTLLTQYIYKRTQKATPTIGIDFLTTGLDLDANTKVPLQLWDTAGQEQFWSITTNYTRSAFIAIVVYAVDNPQSLDNIELWIKNFVLIHSNNQNTHIIVVGNKSDLIGDPDLSKASAIAEKFGGKLILASALTEKGIEEMSQEILRLVSEDFKVNGSDGDDDDQVMTLSATHKRKGCC